VVAGAVLMTGRQTIVGAWWWLRGGASAGPASEAGSHVTT
jgi:hypothetical protein